EAHQTHAFWNGALRLNARRALLGEQALPRVGIGRLSQPNLVIECLTIHVREVEMAQSMVADLKIGIGDELLGSLFMRFHPFAAGEERGLHPLGAEKVDNPPV